MWKAPVGRAFSLVVMMVSPMSALALCCPGEGQINKPAGSGIGQGQTRADDLSQDPRWSVHEFERDAVNYFQISKPTGTIEFILGKVGNHYWLLPAGPTETQISLPDELLTPAKSVKGKVVFQHPEFRLLVSEAADSFSWHVEEIPPGS